MQQRIQSNDSCKMTTGIDWQLAADAELLEFQHHLQPAFNKQEKKSELANILGKSISFPDEALCTSHLLPCGSTPGGPTGTQGGMVQFWYLLFPCGGGQLFSFGNDFAGPQRQTHGICSCFGQQYIALDRSFFTPLYFISIPNFYP